MTDCWCWRCFACEQTVLTFFWVHQMHKDCVCLQLFFVMLLVFHLRNSQWTFSLSFFTPCCSNLHFRSLNLNTFFSFLPLQELHEWQFTVKCFCPLSTGNHRMCLHSPQRPRSQGKIIYLGFSQFCLQFKSRSNRCYNLTLLNCILSKNCNSKPSFL